MKHNAILLAGAIALAMGGCTARSDTVHHPSETDTSEQNATAERDSIISRWNLGDYDSAQDDLIVPDEFLDVFEPIGTLSLDNELLIGEIGSLDVNDRGDVLLLDKVTREVYLFPAMEGKPVTLSPEQCHPGYRQVALFAEFTPDQEIVVVSNTIPGAIYYRADGTCDASAETGALAPKGIASIGNRRLAVHSSRPDLVEVYTIDFGGARVPLLKSDRFGILYSRLGNLHGSLSLVGSNELALAKIESAELTVIDWKSGSSTTFGGVPANYRAIDEDVNSALDPTATREVFNDIKRIAESRSRTEGQIAVSSEVVVLFYLNKETVAGRTATVQNMRILSTREHSGISSAMAFRPRAPRFVGGGYGFLFRDAMEYRFSESQGDENPRLVVYRLRDSI